MLSSLEIAQQATLRPIAEIAAGAGLEPDEIEFYGPTRRRSTFRARPPAPAPDGKLVCVTAITPTRAGEGKTTTSVSLTQGLGAVGAKPGPLPARSRRSDRSSGSRAARPAAVTRRSCRWRTSTSTSRATSMRSARRTTCWRRSSRRTSCTGTRLGIDPLSVTWRRCMDMNDRALRDIVVGLGGKANGYVRADRLRHHRCLRGDGDRRRRARPRRPARAARRDHRRRRRYEGEPVTAEQLRAAGRDDGAAERRAQAEPRPDARGPAGVRPLRPVREHRPWQQLARRRPRRAQARRLRRHREWLRLRHGHGEVPRHRLPGRAGSSPSAIVLVATVRALKHHGGEPDGGLDAIERGAGEPRAPPRHHRRLRAEGGRRGEPLPRRHRRGARARAPARRSSTAPTRPSSTRASSGAARARRRLPRL